MANFTIQLMRAGPLELRDSRGNRNALTEDYLKTIIENTQLPLPIFHKETDTVIGQIEKLEVKDGLLIGHVKANITCKWWPISEAISEVRFL